MSISIKFLSSDVGRPTLQCLVKIIDVHADIVGNPRCELFTVFVVDGIKRFWRVLDKINADGLKQVFIPGHVYHNFLGRMYACERSVVSVHRKIETTYHVCGRMLYVKLHSTFTS